ncbi:MAG TPA: hypothetical protein VHQ45_07440 [Gemmatimonadaceae bacterium]|nr:hypothetical protein [Gemmatimonadaceae bacterium]
MKRVRALAVAVAGLLAADSLGAQGYFGQNQVQYDTFRWRVIETEHFQVHYYPEIEQAAYAAARMSERSYARLSRVLGHQFREKKPIILFASRADFAQNNVFGDLGEGTGGVTDALRQRNTFFFTGDLGESEHVLTHEMVHVFQYDIFSRGQAGANLQALSRVQPPLWLMEGMAEYLSIGPSDPNTNAIMRDAALSGKLPSIEEMTQRPDLYFPYRYGQSLLAFVGQRWGDASIGSIMNAVPNVGIERAFKRELGIDLEELGSEWKEWVQAQNLPQIAQKDRARKFAEPLLNKKRTGGVIPLYVAPTLSPDGSKIAYISTGSYLRGEVFLDLYLADTKTGKRLKRLTTSTTNPDQEELRYGYSQSAFSPDGRYLAFTAQRKGKDALNLLDVNRRRVVRRYDTALEQMLNPTFSPDGKRIVFQGMQGGISDLYMIDVDGQNLRRITNDPYGDGKPTWSPDGTRIAFETERGPQTDLAKLRIGKTRIAVLDLASNVTTVLPGQAGRNINPQWSPDGSSLAWISDRTGIPNIFLYDFADAQHYQLTDVFTAVSSFTAVSPAISWARKADKLAFVYFEDGDYTVWSISDPRKLKREPFQEIDPPGTITVVAGAATADTTRAGSTGSGALPAVAAPAVTPPADTLLAHAAPADTGRVAVPAADSARRDSTGAVRPAPAPPSDVISGGRQSAADEAVVLDSTPGRLSVYRSVDGLRDASTPSTTGPTGGVSVAALLDSADLALPDTSTFTEYAYSGGFRPEAVSQPSIGYAQDNFGRGVYGGTAIIFSDLLGNQRMVLAGAINGRVEEAQLFASYSNFSRRLGYTAGIQQQPSFFLSGYAPAIDHGGGVYEERQVVSRYISRTGFVVGLLPRNRFSRLELGAQYSNIDVAEQSYSTFYDLSGRITGRAITVDHIGTANVISPFAAYVSDNTLFGYTGPIKGRRYRFEVAPYLGTWQSTQYSADYRRYDPILFNILTLATRVQANINVGRNEAQFRQALGRPDLIRGYEREFYSSSGCSIQQPGSQCTGPEELIGTRIAFANAELRFPLLRRSELGFLPVFLPPIEGLVFYDAGVAWNGGQDVKLSRAQSDDPNVRSLLTSYGLGVRVNLFGFAMLRWDYTIPLDRPGRKGYWFWTIGQSF